MLLASFDDLWNPTTGLVALLALLVTLGLLVSSMRRVRKARDRIGTLEDKLEARVRDRSENLSTRIKFSDLLASAAKSFLQENADTALRRSLESVGRRLELERLGVYEYDDEYASLLTVCEWSAEGIPALLGERGRIFVRPDGWLHSLVYSDRICVIDRRDEVPEEFEHAREDLGAYSIRSLLAVPMVSDGIVVGLVTATNVTKERSWSEAEVDFLQTFSEIIGINRARQRATTALRSAMSEAQRATRAKDDFLARMNHELRSPLSNVIGMTGRALKAGPPPVIEDYLRSSLENAEALLALLGDLLDLSKIQAGTVRIDEVAFEPREIVAHVSTAYRMHAESKGLSLDTFVDDDVPRALIGDPARLRQVLVNLLSNAIKFTSEGSVSIECSVASSEVDFVSLRFTVEDTGVGIPQDRQDRILEPFEQGDATTNREFGGMGLGLAISKQLIDAMSGQLTLTSDAGRGTRFDVLLRFRILSAEHPASAVRDDESAEVPGVSRRILLADDAPDGRLVAKEILEDLGHEVCAVDDGLKALEKLESETFDVLILDVQMPGLGGVDVTTRIRTEEAGSDEHLSIVALTAYSLDTEREHCLSAGMDAYLTKPLRSESVESVFRGLWPDVDPRARESRPALDPDTSDWPAGLRAALGRVRGRVDVVRSLVSVFREEYPPLIKKLRHGVAEGDSRQVEIAAHRLAGLAADFEAKDITDGALAIERLAVSGALRGILPKLDGLEANFNSLEQTLASALPEP